jgi:23S rRNA pseudouridine2604 synthase
MSNKILLIKLMREKGWGINEACRKWIKKGLVKVHGELLRDGHVVLPPGGFPRPHIELDERAMSTIVILNKPVGIDSRSNKKKNYRLWRGSAYRLLKRNNALDEWQRHNCPEPCQVELRVAGELGHKESGLLMFIGSLDHRILHLVADSKSKVEKEYLVKFEPVANHFESTTASSTPRQRRPPFRADSELVNEFFERFMAGVQFDDNVWKLDKIDIVNEDELRVVVHDTRKHMFHKMINAMELLLDWKIQSVQRVRIGNIRVDDLPLGKWRYLHALEKVVPGIDPFSPTYFRDIANYDQGQ